MCHADRNWPLPLKREDADTTTPSAARNEHEFDIRGHRYRVLYDGNYGRPVLEWTSGGAWYLETDIETVYEACARLAGLVPPEER